MRIVAFGHRKGIGKDVCARFLIAELRIRFPGINIQKIGFADKVKDVAFQLYKWAGLKEGWYYEEKPHLKEVILPKLGKTPREIYIGVGNGIRQAVGYDGTWLDYVFNNIICDVMIIKDLRFPTEADGILSRGGLLYKINCPWSPVVTDGADDKLDVYDKWSGIINNDEKGNFNKLHSQVLEIIPELYKKSM